MGVGVGLDGTGRPLVPPEHVLPVLTTQLTVVTLESVYTATTIGLVVSQRDMAYTKGVDRLVSNCVRAGCCAEQRRDT